MVVSRSRNIARTRTSRVAAAVFIFGAVDWEQGGEATIPLAFQAGRITKIGKYNYNLSVEFQWTAVRPDDAVVPQWGIRLGVVLLLPERASAH